MSEEAKPKKKINLKSRLSSVRGVGSMAGAAPPVDSSAGGSIPAPSSMGEIPAPKVSKASSAGGLAPPAHLLPPRVPEPEESKPVTAQAQTIVIEESEEVIKGRKQAAMRSVLFALIAAVAAGTAGFFIGGVKEKGDRSKLAIGAAGDLVKQISESNQVMSSLSDELRKGSEELTKDKFPAELSEALKKINVPFTTDSMMGQKHIGGLPGDVLGQLITYAGAAKDLNEKKNSLRNLLGIAQKPVEQYIKEKETPVVNFSVLIGKMSVKDEAGKAVSQLFAELVPNKDPFEIDKLWPKKYTVLRTVQKKQKDIEAARYIEGDFPHSEGQTAIPVQEKSVAAFTSQEVVRKLGMAIRDTKEIVDGKESPIPSQQTEGLIREGERLVEALKKVQQAG